MTNADVVYKFWNENKLMNNVSVINFKCLFIVETDKHHYEKIHNAKIWLDAGSTQMIQIMDFDGDVKKFPSDFWFYKTNNVFSYLNETLTIIGKHPSIGNFEAKIIAIEKN